MAAEASQEAWMQESEGQESQDNPEARESQDNPEGQDNQESLDNPEGRDNDTIYQVALLQSLAQGYFDGIISVGELKTYGDTGIGTFEGVNGEMIVLDGVVYQAIEDGSVVRAETATNDG